MGFKPKFCVALILPLLANTSIQLAFQNGFYTASKSFVHKRTKKEKERENYNLINSFSFWVKYTFKSPFQVQRARTRVAYTVQTVQHIEQMCVSVNVTTEHTAVCVVVGKDSSVFILSYIELI